MLLGGSAPEPGDFLKHLLGRSDPGASVAIYPIARSCIAWGFLERVQRG